MPHPVADLLYCFTVYFIALAGLPGIWLAFGRAAWWWRIAPLLVLLAGVAAVPAGDLALFTLTRALAASLPVIAARTWRRARSGQLPKIQFTLRELLIGTVALAIALSILSGLLGQPIVRPTGWMLLGLGVGSLDLLIAAATLGPRLRWWWVLSAMAIVGVAAPSIERELAWPLHDARPYWLTVAEYMQVDREYHWIGRGPFSLPRELLAMTVSSSSRLVFPGEILLVVICLGSRLARPAQSADARNAVPTTRPRSGRSFARAAVAVCFWLVAIFPGLVVWHNMPPPGILPKPVRSGENVYYRLTGLSQNVDTLSPPAFRWQDLWNLEALAAIPPDVLQQFVQANPQVFEDFHQLVWQPSWMPIEEGDLMPNHDAVFSLHRYLRAYIRGLLEHGQQGDAEELLLDQIRFGRCAGYSPYVAFEGAAHRIELNSLCDAVRNLDLIPISRIPGWLEKLHAIESDRLDADTIRETGRQALRIAYGWPQRLEEALYSLSGLGPVDIGNPDEYIRRNVALVRLLRCELAIRAYKALHGQEPDSLDDLVPEWLPEAPADPHGSGKLIYRSTGAGHVLYSIGPNHVDDGGTHVETSVLGKEGDLFLDSYLDEK